MALVQFQVPVGPKVRLAEWMSLAVKELHLLRVLAFLEWAGWMEVLIQKL